MLNFVTNKQFKDMEKLYIYKGIIIIVRGKSEMTDSIGKITYNNWDFKGLNTNGISGSTNKNESFEDYQKRVSKERAENARKYEEKKEYEKALKQLEAEQNATIDTVTLQRAKSAKEKSDGTFVEEDTIEKYRELPLGKKITRALSNMWQGTFKIATDFIGMEKDKESGEFKWNPLKCALNVGVAAACIGLCFACPPATPYIIGIGTAAAAGQTGYGIYKVCKANDPKQIDEGFQDIGGGLTGIGLSLLGAKTCIKTLPKTSSTGAITEAIGSGTKTATTVAKTASAKTRLSASSLKALLTKNEYAKGNFFTQGIKDLTINLPRAAVQSQKQFSSSVKNIGLLKTLKANFIESVPKFGRAKFILDKKQVHQQLTKELADIDARLGEINNLINKNGTSQELNNEYAILKNLRTFIEGEHEEIMNAATRDAFSEILKNSKAEQELLQWSNALKALKKQNSFEIELTSGEKYNLQKSEEMVKCLNILKEAAKSRASAIKNLCNTKRSTMRYLAFDKNNAAKIDAYTGKNRTNTIQRIYDTTPKLTWKSGLHTLFRLTMLQFLPWEYVSKINGGQAFIAMQAVQSMTNNGYYENDMVPEIASMFGKHLWGDETLTTNLAVTNEQGQPMINENGKVVTQRTALTKDLLAQQENKNQEFEAAKAELNNKIKSLNCVS